MARKFSTECGKASEGASERVGEKVYDDYSVDGDDDDGDVMKQWIPLFRTAQPQISLGLAFFLRSWVDLGKWLYAHTVAQSHICRAMHRRHVMPT